MKPKFDKSKNSRRRSGTFEVLRPTWVGALPIYIGAIIAKTERGESCENEITELNRMAQAADKWNELQKK